MYVKWVSKLDLLTQETGYLHVRASGYNESCVTLTPLLQPMQIMPDNKTVYITDDGTNVGFFKFVSDVAGDFSSGTPNKSVLGGLKCDAQLFWVF